MALSGCDRSKIAMAYVVCRGLCVETNFIGIPIP